MSGKKKQKTETRQDNSIDPWSRARIERFSGKAQSLIDGNPFASYDAPRVAEINDMQRDARNDFRENMGEGVGLMGAAADAAMLAGGYLPERVSADSFANADLDAYLNPFQEQVIDANARRIDRDRDMALADQRDAALTSGAWGGSRSGVQQSETARAYDDRKADMAARLQAEGFNAASNLFTADANRALQADTANTGFGLQGAGLRLQGADLLGQLGGRIDEAGRANAGFLNMLGSQDQAVQQAMLDADYAEAMRAYDDPFRRAQMYMGLTGLQPVIQDSRGSSTTVQSSSPGLMGIAGLAMQGASMFSDARLKRDVAFMKQIDGLNLYQYRYLWDADDAPLRTGVMAQEVARTHPHAVETDPASGFLKVRYDALLETL